MSSSRDFSPPAATEPQLPCYAVRFDDSACPLKMFWVRNSYTAKVSETSSHLHVRATLMVRWFIAAHFGRRAGSQIFRLRGLNTANVGSSRDISLHSATEMKKHVGQLVAQHPHRRCFGNEPPAVHEARFGKGAGLAGTLLSSSDAPACASLVWVAFEKSSLLALACEDIRAMTTHLARRLGKIKHVVPMRCPCEQEVDWAEIRSRRRGASAPCRRLPHGGQPLHPRGLRPCCHGQLRCLSRYCLWSCGPTHRSFPPPASSWSSCVQAGDLSEKSLLRSARGLSSSVCSSARTFVSLST